MKRKNRKKIILFLGAMLLVAAAATYTVLIKPTLEQEEWIYLETNVEQGDIRVGVTESGSLEFGITTQLYDLDLDVSEEDDEDDEDESDEEETEKYLKIGSVNIVVGERISEGDVLFTFTEDSIAGVRRLLESHKTEKEITLAETQSEYNLEALAAKQSYNLSMTSQGVAQTKYNAKITTAQNEIDQLVAEWENLQLKLSFCQDKLTKALEDFTEIEEEYLEAKETLEQIGTEKDLVYINHMSKYESAKSQWENAKEQIEEYQKEIQDYVTDITEYQEKMEISSAKISVDELEARQVYEEADLSGNIATSVYSNSLATLQSTVTEAADEVEKAKKQLKEFEDFVGDGNVYAKDSGIVTEIGYEAGDYLITSGSLISYATSAEMTVTVDVAQEDVVSLSIGDRVEVIFAAYEDEVYEGVISSITTTSTSEHAATVSYPVLITIKGDTSKLYGGMTADVTFVTEELKDVTYVSKNAIVSENNKTYVYTDGAGRNKELKEVTTGLSNGINIQIIDGLAEGDIVYIASIVTDNASDTKEEETASTNEGSPGENEQMPENSEGMPAGEMPNSGMPGDEKAGDRMPQAGGK